MCQIHHHQHFSFHHWKAQIHSQYNYYKDFLVSLNLHTNSWRVGAVYSCSYSLFLHSMFWDFFGSLWWIGFQSYRWNCQVYHSWFGDLQPARFINNCFLFTIGKPKHAFDLFAIKNFDYLEIQIGIHRRTLSTPAHTLHFLHSLFLHALFLEVGLYGESVSSHVDPAVKCC